ncbi:hypothetical protein OBK05_07235 [Empedobacter falsenii]
MKSKLLSLFIILGLLNSCNNSDDFEMQYPFEIDGIHSFIPIYLGKLDDELLFKIELKEDINKNPNPDYRMKIISMTDVNFQLLDIKGNKLNKNDFIPFNVRNGILKDDYDFIYKTTIRGKHNIIIEVKNNQGLLKKMNWTTDRMLKTLD